MPEMTLMQQKSFQGSRKTTGGEFSFSPFRFYLSLFSYLHINYLATYLPILPFLIAEMIVISYISISRVRRGKRRFFSYLKQEMMDVRRGFKDNILNKHVFSDRWWQKSPSELKKYYKSKSDRVTYYAIRGNRNPIKDINDYIRIDDFYSKLRERNSYIDNSQPIDDIALLKLNKNCLDLAEGALEKIDWSKYK
jgi:hypothetical protein